MKRFLTLVCTLFTLVATSFAQRVAVVDFNAGVGISQQDVDGIAAIFNTYFSPNGYTLVERTTIDRVIDEQQFQRGKISEQQMVRLGQILNVSKIVIGDVNIIAGEYNIDVRVVNVESGTIAAKDGATWSQGNTYRELMKGLATRLANQIAITQQLSVKVGGNNTPSPIVRSKVEVVFGYLRVFPSELGTFPYEPKTVIDQINKQGMHDYYTWRLPTAEELALVRAQGLIGGGNYMTSATSASEGIVLLVTDATETHSAKQARLAKEEEKRLEEERRQKNIENGLGDNGVYEVGYYYNRNGKEGVVFEVTNGGRSGKIVSVVQGERSWHKAIGWCQSLGSGWYLPSRAELKSIYRVKEEINNTLKEKGKNTISGWYWSHESADDRCAWGVYMRDGTTNIHDKDYSYDVRAVSAF